MILCFILKISTLFTTMSSEEIITGGQLTYFLTISLSVQYYLLISPFRLKLISLKGGKGSFHRQYQSVCWLPQKCLCAILTVLSLPWSLQLLRTSVPKNQKDPAAYLAVAFYLVVAIHMFGFIKKYWMDQSRILKILSFILDNSTQISIPSRPNLLMKPSAKITMFVLIFMYTAMAMVFWTFRRSTLAYPFELLGKDGKISWSWKWLWASSVLTGKQNLFLGNSSTENIVKWILLDSSNYPFTTWETVVGLMSSAGYYFRLMLISHIELLLGVVSATLWVVAKQFGTEVEDYCSFQKYKNVKENKEACKTELKLMHPYEGLSVDKLAWDEVKKRYEVISELTSLINQVFGWNVGIYLVDCLLYNSISIDEVFRPEIFPDFWQILGLSFYTAGMCTVLFLLADVCRQVEKCLSQQMSDKLSSDFY